MPTEVASEVAERYIVATILYHPTLLDEIVLDHTDFANTDYALVYRTMTWLYEQGKPVTIATIMSKLASRIAGQELTDAMDPNYALPGAIKEHARIVRNAGRKRKLNSALMRMSSIAYEAEEITDEVMASIQTEIAAIEGADIRETGLRHVGDLLPAHFETLERRFKHKGDLAGVTTGFPGLDSKTGGYKAAHLVVVAARPSMGKTAWMLESALAVSDTDVAAVFSLEMGDEMLLDRAYATNGFVRLYRITSGLMQDDDWTKITVALNALSRRNLYLDDTPAITVSYMRSRLRKLRRTMQPGQRLVVFVDYMQILTPERRHQNKTAEVGEISTKLKQLAKELDCCVVALAQLSRAVDQRADKHPMLSDIRETGQIEQDADIIGFLYRDDYYNGDKSEKKGLLEFIVAKNRNGSTGVVELSYLREYQRIYEVPKPRGGEPQ